MPTVIREGVKSHRGRPVPHETNSSPEPANEKHDDVQKSNRLSGDTNALENSELDSDVSSVTSRGGSLDVLARNEPTSGASSRDLVAISTQLALKDGEDEKEQKGETLKYML